jgi:DMSO/TMAO reductase YedYZ molybdopterin-dependent catalytic subunit
MMTGVKLSTVMVITRRKLIAGTAAMTLLAGCKPHAFHAMANLTRGVNDDFEELLFSHDRLAPELPISLQTPDKDFPCYFRSASMPVTPTNWTLKVGGLIQHPLRLRLDQLVGMPATEMRVRHYCVDGWSAVASWRGVRVSEIASLAGLDSRVKYVEYRSFDNGYWSGWDLASAMHPQTMLAYEMNGHPLQANHGAPLRLYSAIKLGYKSVKYLSEINFLPNKVGGYWEERGFGWFAGV